MSHTRALRSLDTHPLQVLLPIYPDFNTFDANGPIEVLSQANRNSGGKHHFQITIAAATELTTSVELVRMARDISLTEAIKRIADWDMILLPGGVEKTILSLISKWQEKQGADGNEVMQLLDQYMTNPEGLTVTICTGSLFLGALGKLAGRTATTHWRSLPTLKNICAELSPRMTTLSAKSQFSVNIKAASPESKIVRARWIDSGKDASEKSSRLITAGGVSCGLDAIFYLLDLTVGSELAEKVAGALDYQRRGAELQE